MSSGGRGGGRHGGGSRGGRGGGRFREGASERTRAAREQQDEIRANKLHVGNLSNRVGEFQIMKLFTPHGRVRRVDFLWHTNGPRRGEPKGYCFVEMETREDAVSVKRAIDGQWIGGRPVHVKFATEDVNYAHAIPGGGSGSLAGGAGATGGGSAGSSSVLSADVLESEKNRRRRSEGKGGEGGGGPPGGEVESTEDLASAEARLDTKIKALQQKLLGMKRKKKKNSSASASASASGASDSAGDEGVDNKRQRQR